MIDERILPLRAKESPDAVERYGKLKKLGQEMFADSGVVNGKGVSERDLKLAKKFIAEGMRLTDPPVWASFWEHLLIAPEIAKRLTLEATQKGVDVNVDKVEFLTWLHDLGRLVTPAAYLRNDYIGNALLGSQGIRLPNEILGNLPSTRKLIEYTARMNINPRVVTGRMGKEPWEKTFSPEQLAVACEYFNSLTPIQRIINLADNLGKRDEKGLFNYEKFIRYLRGQEGRYSKGKTGWRSIDWSTDEVDSNRTTRREAGAILQAFVVDKTILWLKEQGVEVDKVLDSLKDYGPKFVVVVRHGDLDNPFGRVYTRDVNTDSADIIHLSDKGKTQMEQVARLIQERRFGVVKVWVSPETRTRESLSALNSVLKVEDVEVNEGIDDGDCPGPYKIGMFMNDLAAIEGDVYGSRWERFGGEHVGGAKKITQRMESAFRKMASSLKVGETGVLVSHGDPIAFLLNKLVGGEVPDPAGLRSKIYPAKGEAVVVIIDQNNNFFSLYKLVDPKLFKSSIY